MTENKLRNIIEAVVNKYQDLPQGRKTADLIIDDIGAVLKGLYKTENFLTSFKIDLNKKIILCSDPRKDMPFISFLPYLVKALQEKTPNEEVFLVYVLQDKVASLLGSVSFIDMRLVSDGELGFDVVIHNAQHIGYYNPRTDEFKRGESI